MIIWVIGLSGAGKTTIGQSLYNRIKARHSNTVFLDGDIFRSVMGDDLGFSAAEREKNATRQANLCAMLDAQGIHVVCCILANQPAVLAANRKRFRDYFEVFVDVEMDELIRRDPKGLYRKVRNGETRHVVGVDIEFFRPESPDVVIDNTAFVDLPQTVNSILKRVAFPNPLIEDYDEKNESVKSTH